MFVTIKPEFVSIFSKLLAIFAELLSISAVFARLAAETLSSLVGLKAAISPELVSILDKLVTILPELVSILVTFVTFLLDKLWIANKFAELESARDEILDSRPVLAFAATLSPLTVAKILEDNVSSSFVTLKVCQDKTPEEDDKKPSPLFPELSKI